MGWDSLDCPFQWTFLSVYNALLSRSFEMILTGELPFHGLSSSLPWVYFGPVAVFPSEALQGESRFHKYFWLIVLGNWSLGICLAALKGTVLHRPRYVVKLLICMALAKKPDAFWKTNHGRPMEASKTWWCHIYKGRVNRLKYWPCYTGVSPSSGIQ